MGKKKGKKRPKQISYQVKIILTSLILIIIIATVLFFIALHRNVQTKEQVIVFEESCHLTSDLQRKITEIEIAIYEALYKSDIKEKDILFPVVLPRHRDGYDWEFTELVIQLSKDRPDDEIKTIINQTLEKLGPSVRYTMRSSSKKNVILNVYAFDFYTHKITLSPRSEIVHETKRKPRVAIIIDDLGYDLTKAVEFINFEPGLTLSVLPMAPHTQDIVQMVLKQKRELLLHLPMEPKNYPTINPGPGTLLTSMSNEKLSDHLNFLLDSVQGVVGVNNHMGSIFTARADKMSIVLRELARRDLFFIDSRTTAQSVAFDLAGEMGVRSAKRAVFIDDDLSPKAMKYQMERLIGLARHSGQAIGIAHPHQRTLELFKQYQVRLQNEIELVPVSNMVH